MELSGNKVELVTRHNKVVYRDGDRIVKAFVPTKPASDVFREALNLARVAEGDLPVETPEVIEVSRLKDGSWALATDCFEGTTLAEQLLDAGGTPREGELLDQFVGLQIKVQQAPVPAALTHQSAKVVRMIGRVEGLDPSARYDLQMRADRLRSGRAICHGDFNPSNVVVGEQGVCVCDWTHVTIGLPEADAAMTYILFKLTFPALADAYLDAYSRYADMPKQKVRYWLPVVAAAELSRGRKGNEEFLRSMVSESNDYE